MGRIFVSSCNASIRSGARKLSARKPLLCTPIAHGREWRSAIPDALAGRIDGKTHHQEGFHWERIEAGLQAKGVSLRDPALTLAAGIPSSYRGTAFKKLEPDAAFAFSMTNFDVSLNSVSISCAFFRK